MRRILYATVLLLAAMSTRVVAQITPIFPLGEKAPNVHHTGDVWLNELSHADSVFDHNVSVATFAPGAKLDWHAHPGGQILLMIQDSSVRFVGNTAIVLNSIRVDAVVGGNEVTNPFDVTEVYVRQNGDWKLASLSFTRLLR